MGVISIGPLVMAADRFAAILGIGAFLLVASVLAERREPRLGSWAMLAVVTGVAAARMGHVIEHAGSFAMEPLRAFAFWQGGFSFTWSVPVLAMVSLLRLRDTSARAWAVAPLAAGLLVWSTTLHLAEATAAPPRPLPALILPQMAGAPIDLGSTGGRPRMLNLWATWCPPCRREMPLLQEVARTTPGVDFLFVNQGEDRARIAAYLAQAGLNLPHVVLDSTSAVSRHFASRGLPATFFFDADGRMRHLHVGEVSREFLAGYLHDMAPAP